MKTILVPVERHDLVESVLKAATLLGEMFGSYIEGFPLSPAISPFMAADVIGGTIVYDADLDGDHEGVQESRRVFEGFMRANGVSSGAAGGDRPSFSWVEGVPVGDGFLGSYGRVFDITVIGRPTTKASSPRMSTLEAPLFESGRPILIAPPNAPQTLGQNVVIAWNRSTETARAIAFAMPILKRARRTVVLTIEGGNVPGPSGGQVARHLELNGIICEVLSAKPGTRSTGEAILAEATSLGSDLLIKGAFTQSRLRQMIFGGATRHIIAEAGLPVFMAH